MATVNRSQFAKLMLRDLYAWAFETYDKVEPVHTKLFRVENSSGAFEQSTTGVGMGQLSERSEGNQIIESNPLEGYTVYGKNRTFSDSFSLTAEFVEDTPKEKIANIMQNIASTWGEGVINSKESFAAKFFIYGGFLAGNDVFNNSITGVVTDPTGDLGYDGKPFFALSGNNHPAKNGSTYYNGLALALSSTNLQTAYNLMTVTNNRNERGEIVSIQPNVLVIPPSLRFTAKTILESEHIVGSGNNDVNVTQNILQPIEWQYLTDTDAWFIGKAQKGLVWQERKPFVIDFYQNETNKKYYATIDARWGARMDNWRYWVGSNFSTS